MTRFCYNLSTNLYIVEQGDSKFSHKSNPQVRAAKIQLTEVLSNGCVGSHFIFCDRIILVDRENSRYLVIDKQINQSINQLIN